MLNFSVRCRARGMQVLLAVLGMSLPCCTAESDAADAKSAKEMKPYTQEVDGTEVSFKMLPIPGGEFVMGSPKGEADRGDDEGPQVTVKIEPFWMEEHEVTWDEYDIWSLSLDKLRREKLELPTTERDKVADAVTRPTKAYVDMTFEMGHDDFPAICMTQLAAKMYCKWLSRKTGTFYRLPTEAEWEYACRAGTTTAYSFGDSTDDLDDYAWYYDNADEKYQKVMKKKPNPWGLYDMHGNVAEWCLDQHLPDHYGKASKKGNSIAAIDFLAVPKELYPRIVRGGSWDDDPETLRSAARAKSVEEWKLQDPQLPKSIWYHTDAMHVGFRIIRPLKVPSVEERKKYDLEPPHVKNERE